MLSRRFRTAEGTLKVTVVRQSFYIAKILKKNYNKSFVHKIGSSRDVGLWKEVRRL